MLTIPWTFLTQANYSVVDSGVNVVFVTAFLNKMEGLKHLKEIAWETEVWFANEPEHMIHLNGCKFLEVYKKDSGNFLQDSQSK